MPKAKILVVEDSPTMRMYIAFALKKIPNVQVLEACDGMEAMKKLSEGGIDLVILDVNMPLMSGFEVLKKIRNDPEMKDLPVVMCTTEADSREEGEKLGANAYLSKPVQHADLNEAVKKYLEIKVP